jgi:hypothetical protein
MAKVERVLGKDQRSTVPEDRSDDESGVRRPPRHAMVIHSSKEISSNA